MDTIQGSAGTNAHSSLDSSFVFSLTTASALHFDFNLGVYIAAFLSANAAQVAHANWSLGFTLTDTNDTSISHILSSSGVIIPGFSLGDTVSNNAPGTGTTRTGSQNSALNLNGTPVLTNRFFNTDVLAGNTSYTLSAFIDTGANVTTVAVPEPEALALLGMGLLGMAASSRKFKNLFRLTNA